MENKYKNIYIIIHQGIGDIFNSIGIINYYHSTFNNSCIYVCVLDNMRKKIIENIYYDNKKIKTIIPEFISYQKQKGDTCIKCMTYGKVNSCPRENGQCQFVNYNKYNSKNNLFIKIGSFNNYDNWENYRKSKFSFAHSFYTYNNLDEHIRFKNFKIFNNKDEENNKYNDFIKKYGSNYILVHEDNDRNLKINKDKIKNKNLPIINLNKISNIFVDFIKIIKNASEIHLIDSSWSVFIYLLNYKDIKDIPIFLNESYFKLKGRDTNIYKNPSFSNWVFY